MTLLYRARIWWALVCARTRLFDHRLPGSCTAGECICTSER